MKWLDFSDVEFLDNHANISICETRKVASTIHKAATEQGFPPKDNMTIKKATTCYYFGERWIFVTISVKAPQRRSRTLAWMKWVLQSSLCIQRESEKSNSMISLLNLLCFNVILICHDKLKCLGDLFVHLAVLCILSTPFYHEYFICIYEKRF